MFVAMKPQLASVLLLCSFASFCCEAVWSKIDKVASPLASIIEHEDERYVDDDLFKLVDSKDPEIRQRAIVALGRIGDPRAVEVLSSKLEAAPDASERAIVAFALGEIENESAIPVLSKQMQAAAEGLIVKARCVEALGKICANKRAAAAIGNGRLQKTAQDIFSLVQVEGEQCSVNSSEHNLIVSLGLSALLRIKQENSLDAITLQLKSKNSAIRAQAANVLSRSKLNYSGACPVLLNNLADDDSFVRANAARALGAAKYIKACGQLIERLRDQDSRVVCNAIAALGEISEPSSCVPLVELGEQQLSASLRQQKKSQQVPVEQNELLLIATALGNIKDNRALPLLQKMRFACSRYGRAPELEIALAKFGEAEFFNENQSWKQACDRKWWQSTAAFAQGLGELKGSRAEKALLDVLHEHPDARAISDLLTALAACKSEKLKDVLLSELKNKDVVVRATAASLLGDMGDSSPLVIDALRDAYAKARQEKMNDARLAIIETCDKLKRPMSVAVLSGELRDHDYIVRRRAFELLKESGADTSTYDPGKVGSGHDERFWQQMSRLSKSENPRAIIRCKKGNITVELFAADAPMTVSNFITLARNGYYDKLTFMRVVPNFVIQGGDPRNDMNGGPGYQIRCEINTHRYETGSLGMALSGKDTGGSQFFLTHSPQPHLDGGYTCFGRVVEGMDVLNAIARGDVIEHIDILDKEIGDAKN